MKQRQGLITLTLLLALGKAGNAQETGQSTAVAPVQDKARMMFGHSNMGEAFNEGPRWNAHLMRGMAKIVFPITTKNKLAQRFFEQGVSQLHGYWYYEAERSFRKVIALDPECLMGYWGMAMAHFGDDGRVKGILTDALEKRKSVTEKERMWVDSLYAYHTADSKQDGWDKKRKLAYIQSLQQMVDKYPTDLEAKAFLGHELMANQDISGRKPEEIDTLLNQILAVNPLHPIHHYRIHLWDNGTDKAINSAANCGLSAPGIAHLWHMQGHTYTGLKRYADAAFSQEASARVDHAYMIRDRVMPDQIHNYAHNNQWLVEDLEFVGRVRAALDLAKNMIELPRHPRYNTITGFQGSSSNGRRRLFETLTTYDLWKTALELDTQGFLEITKSEDQQKERLRLLGVAGFASGNPEVGQKHLAALQAMLAPKSSDKDADTKKEKTEEKTDDIPDAVAEVKGYAALAQGNLSEASKLFDKVGNLPKARLARIRLALGQKDKAEEAAREAVKQNPNRVAPLATLVEVLYQVGKKEEAKTQFQELGKIAATADLDTPLLAKLAPIAKEFGLSTDWRTPGPPPEDIGKWPALSSLGPFRWSPPPAPSFSLPDAQGKNLSLADYRKRGKPVLVIFFLGSACEQCLEQLNVVAPLTADFEKAGISLVAVSTDAVKDLEKTKLKEGKHLPFPVVSDKDYKAFKAFRAFDDFEGQPLHGLYLIDEKGRIRWQDISFQPFKEGSFLLEEAKRLLAQNQLPPTNNRTLAHANTTQP